MAEPRFGFLGRGAFLNHASVAPPCRAARRAVHEAADRIAYEDERFVFSRRTSTEARGAFADYVRSRVERVMCFQNTSAALSAVAWGLRWRKGDEVWVSRNEFVSNFLTWELQRRRGVRVRMLPTKDEWVDPGVLERELGPRTRVVAVSAVHWATGAKQDLRALADVVHDRGALLVVDAAQSLGAAPHGPRQDRYDVLATNTYKWMLSYNGTAFADFSKEALEQLDLASVGWLSVAGEPEPDVIKAGRPSYSLGSGVEKFLGGAPSALSNVAAIAAMRDLQSYGQARVAKEVVRVAQDFMAAADELKVDVVTPREAPAHAGIVALRTKDPVTLAKRLRAKGIRAGSRGGFLRLSPHFYTGEAERDAFVRAFSRLAA